jgi:hypothetical protein
VGPDVKLGTMKTNPRHFCFAGRLAGAKATLSLTATLILISGRAHAQNYAAATVVPEHVYMMPGYSIRNGDLVAIESSCLFFFGPIRRPAALVARAMLGAGGSGVGVGLAGNVTPPRPGEEVTLQGDDFFWGPFVSLEAHVERMYPLLTSWRHATFVGPQLSMSIFVLKASVGWMFDVNARTDQHLQIGLGAGF